MIIVRRFLIPLTWSAMAAFSVEVAAQSAFPAPLPNPSAQGSAQGPFQGPFPAQGAAPLGGGLAAGSFGQQECVAKFASLRQDAEKQAALIKAASARKAPPQEACKLLKGYVEAETILVSYVETRQIACGIPADFPKQLKANQARSQEMMKKVCEAANWPQPQIQPKRLRIARVQKVLG
jgi:hypothetical protein